MPSETYTVQKVFSRAVHDEKKACPAKHTRFRKFSLVPFPTQYHPLQEAINRLDASTVQQGNISEMNASALWRGWLRTTLPIVWSSVGDIE